MRRGCKFQVYLYIFCTVVSLLSLFFDKASIKIIQVLPIGIAVLSFLVTADTNDTKPMVEFTILYSIWLVFVITMSMLAWTINLSEFSYIKRGFQKCFFQFFTIAIIATACYMFKEKAIEYTFYSFCIFNTICILLAFKQCGPSQSISDFMYFLTSGFDAQGFMKLLELSDGTYPFAFFLLYFIFEYKNGWKKYIDCFLCLVFLFTGMKRIAILAILLACFVGYILRKMDEEKLKKLVIPIGIGILLFGFCYIILVRYDVFSLVMNAIGIDTMGRNDLYDFVHNYYKISPLFIGNGYEFITTLFTSIQRWNGMNLGKIQALHNSYLTIYLEVGFFGFIFWMWHGFTLIPQVIKKKYGRDFLILFYVEAVFVLITYLTDNTAFVFFSSMTYKLIHIGMACKVKKDVVE